MVTTSERGRSVFVRVIGVVQITVPRAHGWRGAVERQATPVWPPSTKRRRGPPFSTKLDETFCNQRIVTVYFNH